MKNMITNFLLRAAASFLILCFLILMTACGAPQASYIFVLDLTASVSPEAKRQAFETVRQRAKLLRRGDSMTVIPLAGDAQTDTGGNVLHLEVGEKRELADADLDKFFALADSKLNEMQANAKNYNQTDLLGALRVAQEEISLTDAKDRRIFVVILSDMVHSTKQIRFESDANLAKSETARKFAETVARKSPDGFKDGEIYIGLLESSDLRKMPDERREAVRDFWQEYFDRCGAKRVQTATDGTGQLEKFVNQKDKT